MAARTKATFAKRQKERARQEKQQAKQERRLQRKLEKREGPPDSEAGEFDPATEIPPRSEHLSHDPMAASQTAPTERESQ